MVYTTDKPALTINQRAALLTHIRDYANAHADAEAMQASGASAWTVDYARDVASTAYRHLVAVIDDLRFVEGAIEP